MNFENRNAMYDSERNVFYFKRCPRTFLKTDMPAKHPRTDCPFRSRKALKDSVTNQCHCFLPTGLNYAEKMTKGLEGEKLFMMMRICYLESNNKVKVNRWIQ